MIEEYFVVTEIGAESLKHDDQRVLPGDRGQRQVFGVQAGGVLFDVQQQVASGVSDARRKRHLDAVHKFAVFDHVVQAICERRRRGFRGGAVESGCRVANCADDLLTLAKRRDLQPLQGLGEFVLRLSDFGEDVVGQRQLSYEQHLVQAVEVDAFVLQ